MATISEMKREDDIRGEETLEDYLARLQGRTLVDAEADMAIGQIRRISKQMGRAYDDEDIVEGDRLLMQVVNMIDKFKAQQAGRIEAAFLTAA